MKTLYITDLDGTLLTSGCFVSDASTQMLNKAIAEGALFSIATARTPSTVSQLLARVDTRLPYIVMTGSAIWNRADGTYSHVESIPQADATGILEVIRRNRVPAFVYCLRQGVIHVYHTGPLSDIERRFIDERTGSRFKFFHIPADGESIFPSPLSDVSLFYAMQPAAILEGAFEEIKGHFDCNPLFYLDSYSIGTGILEIFSSKATKANALRWLKSHTGADRVVCFGDNVNDIPMLREADVAVAVENALPEVKSMADVVIGSNDSDAVASFILSDFRSQS